MNVLRAASTLALTAGLAGCASFGDTANETFGDYGCAVAGAVVGGAAGAAVSGGVGAPIGIASGAVLGGVLCPASDDDGDGVRNEKDECPATPADVAVNASGCPIDSDSDGVADFKDACPDTVPQHKVDGTGCPADTDGDGVADFKDACPTTGEVNRITADGCPIDLDGDGVADHADACKFTPAGAAVDASGCAVDPQPVLTHTVHFDFDRAVIRADQRPKLDEIATLMRERAGYLVRIFGHADSTGPLEYNRLLSVRRADAVVEYLVDAGVERDRFRIAARGETEPAASNATVSGRAANRRVEFEVLGR